MIRRLIFCASLLPLCAPLCISLPASAQQSSPAMPPAPGMNKMDGMDNMEMGQHTPSTQPPAKTTPDQQSTASSTAPSLLLAVQGRPPLTLDAFLSIAQRSNPTLGESEAQVRAARAEAIQAGLYPNPTIGYSGDHIRGGSYGGGEQGGYLQQEIVLGGKLGLQRNVYTQEANALQLGADAQVTRVRSGVQGAFYAALAAQELVTLRGRLLRVATDAAETERQLANIGQADEPAVLQAEVDKERAQIDYLDAQRMYLNAFNTLATTAGQAALPPSPLTGDLQHPPQIDPQQEVDTFIAHSPLFQRAEQEVSVAEASLAAAKRASVPDLTVRAGEWGSGEQLNDSHKGAGPESFAEVSLPLPLWNRNQGAVQAAAAKLERARDDVKRTRLLLQAGSAPLAQQYLSERFRADRLRAEILPRARRSYELSLSKYRQMVSPYPQVLAAQRMLFELQMEYVQALGGEWSSALLLSNSGLTQPLQMTDER